MRNYFSWTIASVISLAGIGAASAADMAVKARPAPVVLPYNWTGCYIGGNVGGKWANSTNDVFVPGTIVAPDVTHSFGRDNASTVIGGGQVGCNWQTGAWVFGIEGDAQAQRWSSTRTTGASAIPPFVPGDTFDLRSDWQASVRGRVGYAWDRTLLYVTGGAAFTNVRAGSNFIADGIFPQTLASETKTLIGGTVGAGVEYAVGSNWTVGVEGRYSWYGRHTFDAGSVAAANIGVGAPLFVFVPATQTVRVDTAEVLLRANWKFNSGAAVVARY
jgi:outer membrane immunogenic protein